MEYISEIGEQMRSLYEDNPGTLTGYNKIPAKSTLGELGLDLYTGNRDLAINGVYNHGSIDHFTQTFADI